MNKLFLTMGAIALLAACNNAPKQDAAADAAIEEEPMEETMEGPSGTYAIDATASQVMWTGSKIAGESHSGTMMFSEGTVMMENGAITGGKVIIDITSLEDTDLEGEYKMKLEGHLKSADFFDAENFPMAVLEIKGAEAINEDSMNIMGELTLKGNTAPITIPAAVMMEEGKVMTEGTFMLDRTKWEMKYGSGTFFDDLGDKVINDEVEVSIKAVAMAGEAMAEAGDEHAEGEAHGHDHSEEGHSH